MMLGKFIILTFISFLIYQPLTWLFGDIGGMIALLVVLAVVHWWLNTLRP
ncbi:hypothetical protein [uncultured Thiothrix sp.]|nr:hypothetical protein [uncultured Thiothrix sp.]